MRCSTTIRHPGAPRASADRVLEHVAAEGLTVELILETHVHADHLSAASYLRQQTGAPIAIGASITTVQETFSTLFNAEPAFRRDGSQFDRLLRDGDRFSIGSIACSAMHTPGHTPNCMVYVVGDAAFVGDTLFMPDYGTARCDFPGGDAERSIARFRGSSRCPMTRGCSYATTTRLPDGMRSPGRARWPSSARATSTCTRV